MLRALLVLFAALPVVCAGAEPRRFTAKDVFDLEWISDIDVSADGRSISYLRHGFDATSDRATSSLWLASTGSSATRPLVADFGSLAHPTWSPDGKSIAFVSDGGKARPELFTFSIETGHTQRLTDLTHAPQSLAWSPDGKQIAFLMSVPGKPALAPALPEKPEGAAWAPSARVIDRLIYRRDGEGYVEPGFVQLFVVPSEGGTPRALTDGPYEHEGRPAWLPDGKSIVIAGNRRDDWEYDATNTELYRVDVASGAITALTDRDGPDEQPVVAPDGRTIAYLGYDDDRRSHINRALYLLDLTTHASRRLSPPLPDGIARARWDADGKSLVVQYDAEGTTRIARIDLSGRLRDLVTKDVGGLDIGRPYSEAMFALGGKTLAFTAGDAYRPADVAVLEANGAVRRVTSVNEDVLAHEDLATVESRAIASPVDRAHIDAWLVKPPGFDAAKAYPLILEIHGGPHANYGPHFSAEMQLYAAAGYLVLYANPRGSTSYGEAFANLIDKSYPGNDYDDLMAVVDAIVAEGHADPRNLFVTGGSGGGILTAWIVGKTDRFRAAAAVKPVINWYSEMLTADIGNEVATRWFHGVPWEHTDEYVRRSPLSLVGNVKTPTLLMTGEVDYRTPISEAEQFYQALKMRKVDALLVRFPEASHELVGRPSQLAAKVGFILGWFDRYRVRD